MFWSKLDMKFQLILALIFTQVILWYRQHISYSINVKPIITTRIIQLISFFTYPGSGCNVGDVLWFTEGFPEFRVFYWPSLSYGALVQQGAGRQGQVGGTLASPQGWRLLSGTINRDYIMSFGSSLHCKILKCNMLKFLKDQVQPADFRVSVLLIVRVFWCCMLSRKTVIYSVCHNLQSI